MRGQALIIGGRREAAPLLAIGRLKPGPEAALFEHYNARLRPPLAVTELPEARGSAAEVGGARARRCWPPCPKARCWWRWTSAARRRPARRWRLAERWEATAGRWPSPSAGAEGLDPAVLARADHLLSLGPLTWPHFLVRGLLAEQWYRVQAIRTASYHRVWRPG